MVRSKRVTSNEPRLLVDLLLLRGPMQRYIYRKICIPRTRYIILLSGGLFANYKKPMNDEDVIMEDLLCVVLEAACVELYRPQFL